MRRRSECRPANCPRDESQHPEYFQDADLRGSARRLERRSQHRFLVEQELKYFRAKLENLGPPISGHVADFSRGKSELGLAARSRTVAGGCSGGRAARALVDSAADTAAATENESRRPAAAATDFVNYRVGSAQRVPGCRSTTCRSAASFCPDSRRRLSPPSCQARFCQKSSSALRLPRKILRSALRMLAILVG